MSANSQTTSSWSRSHAALQRRAAQWPIMRRRSMTFGAFGLLVVASASVLVSGCSTNKTPDAVAASPSAISSDSTVSSDLVNAPDSVDSDNSDGAAAGSTQTSLPAQSIAVGEPNPATPSDANTDLTAESVPNPETNGEDPAAASLEGPAELTDEQLTSAFEAMGIPVAVDKLACVKQTAGKTDMSSPEPPPEFLRALMSCVPQSLVEANGEKLSASAVKSGVTVEKAGCFQAKTFETMAATDIAEFTKLLDANAPIDFPADMKAKLKEATKVCVLSDAQFLSLLEG